MDNVLTACAARSIVDMCAVEKRVAALELAVAKFTSTNTARDEIRAKIRSNNPCAYCFCHNHIDFQKKCFGCSSHSHFVGRELSPVA